MPPRWSLRGRSILVSPYVHWRHEALEQLPFDRKEVRLSAGIGSVGAVIRSVLSVTVRESETVGAQINNSGVAPRSN